MHEKKFLRKIFAGLSLLLLFFGAIPGVGIAAPAEKAHYREGMDGKDPEWTGGRITGPPNRCGGAFFKRPPFIHWADEP